MAARRLVGAGLAGLLVACTGPGSSDGAGDRSPGSSSSPLPSPGQPGAVDPAVVEVGRGPFCDRIGAGAVRRVLGGPAQRTHHYGNGDSAELTPGYVDVAHEYNCSFERGEATARAWVFAPPIRPDVATRVVAEIRAQKGCVVSPGSRFGQPSVTTVCTLRQPSPTTRVSQHGLFGDAWLSCELTVPRTLPGPQPAEDIADIRDRTAQWCADVLAAADTG